MQSFDLLYGNVKYISMNLITFYCILFSNAKFGYVLSLKVCCICLGPRIMYSCTVQSSELLNLNISELTKLFINFKLPAPIFLIFDLITINYCSHFQPETFHQLIFDFQNEIHRQTNPFKGLVKFGFNPHLLLRSTSREYR